MTRYPTDHHGALYSTVGIPWGCHGDVKRMQCDHARGLKEERGVGTPGDLKRMQCDHARGLKEERGVGTPGDLKRRGVWGRLRLHRGLKEDVTGA